MAGLNLVNTMVTSIFEFTIFCFFSRLLLFAGHRKMVSLA